ncbi:MAG: hypothetical protein V1904_01595 [Bacteroidota bacterium]
MSRFHYLIIAIFAFILYGNTIPNDYSLDDNLVVLKNKQVMKGISAIPEIFTSHYREDERNEYGYRPVAKSTFAIESEFFTQNPHVSHFINILLYIGLLLLLLKLLNKIFPDISGSLKLMIILLFAAHPLHTEVVANLKNREELLCFLFAVAASLFFIKAVTSQKLRGLYLILGFISISLSILSKQTGLVFCIIIPVIILQFFIKPVNPKKILLPENKTLLRKYLSLLVFSVFIIILGYAVYKAPDIALPAEDKILNGYENPLFLDNSLYNRICLGFMGLLYYFKLVFIPYPLCFYYGFGTVPLTGMGDFRVILSIIIYLFLFSAGVFLFYKNRIISFGIMFYLIGLTMFANLYLPIPGIIGERLLFVSSFGFCVAIGGVILMIINRMIQKGKIKADKLPWTVYLIISVIILVYSAQTIARNRDWKNHATLYKADIVHLEESAKANSLYADEIMRQVYEGVKKNKPADQSKIELALNHYIMAIEIYPEFPSVYNNIGTIYFMFYKDYGSALSYFKKAEEIDSLSHETVYNLAFAYDKEGDTVKALYYYEKAVKKDSANIELISRWANLVYATGDMDRAIELNMKIIKINPSSDSPYINIGNYYGALKDTATAVSYWEKAIAVAPVNDKVNAFLATYFKKKGDLGKYDFYSQKISSKVK